jgi:polyisoprenoid-binding protein YceI
MYQKIASFTLILGLIIFFAVGCSSQPVEEPPTEVGATLPTDMDIPPALPPTETATVPSSEETPVTDSESVSAFLRFAIVPEQSEARYRVQEQLAGFDLPNDAVGTTQAISGTVVISMDGSIDASASRFEVDLSTLTSDQSRRDNYLRTNTLRTDQYPLTVFVPEYVSGLPDDLPQSGQVAFSLVGNLTILDVTKPVEWDVTGNLQGNVFSGLATTSFTFDYFELDQPRVASVLSIEDDIRLEVDFTLQRVDG